MIQNKPKNAAERVFGGKPTKKQLLTATAAVLMLILTLIGGALSRERKVQQTTAEAVKNPVIILDPGHGGVDGGAVGINGTVEKRINLEIALQLRDVLTRAGYTVIMTRDTDISIHDSDAVSVREKKVSDMHNRLKLTELYPESLLVSVHQNTLGSDSSVTGAQVFFSPNDPQSAVLAQSIQDEFNAALQETERTTKQAGKNLYLFYHAKNAAVLTECGFLSNPEEERLLGEPEYQKKIVFCIYKGIIEYLGGERTAV